MHVAADCPNETAAAKPTNKSPHRPIVRTRERTRSPITKPPTPGNHPNTRCVWQRRNGRLGSRREEGTTEASHPIHRISPRSPQTRTAMSTTIKRLPLADRLRQSLTEGMEYARGQVDLAKSIVPAGRSYAGEEVVAIRTRRQMSQAQFAKLLAVNVKTLQSWEQGVRKPSKPTMRLLQIFDRPDEFLAVLVADSAKNST